MTNDPRSLDPNTYYRAADLLNRCDIPTATIAAARAAGRLTAANVGATDRHADDGFRYRGSDVTAWLDSGAPTAPTGKTAAAPPATGRIMPKKPGAVIAFEQLVDAELKAGAKTKANATRAVVRKNPELHADFLKAAKVNRS